MKNATTKFDEKYNATAAVLKSFSKNERGAASPFTFSLIKEAYADALEYTGIARGTRGMILFSGLLSGGLGYWFAWEIFTDQLESGVVGISDWLTLLCSIIFAICGSYLLIKSIRLELFRPEDEPTIFDRKSRKVYRIYRETYAGWRGLLHPWPLKSVEHDWDMVDAEHQAAINANTATISRIHALVFLVRTSATDSTLVDSFTIGNSMQMGEVTVPAVWEHIRRFMEEGGAHLAPGEALVPFEKAPTFWRCLAATGPYGANFKIWWRTMTGLMIACFILFPISLPLLALLGVFNWLSHRTSVPIHWSPHVLAAIGPAMSRTHLAS